MRSNSDREQIESFSKDALQDGEKLFETITERKVLEERLSVLNFYAGKLNTEVTIEQVYELTLDVMEQTLGFEHAAFMVIDKGNLRIASYR